MIFARANFMFERGITTSRARERAALRMRVSMSEIGSVIILPARFTDARNLTNVGKLAEADTAEAEVAEEETRTATAPATVYLASRKLLLSAFGLCNLIFGCHSYFDSGFANGKPSPLKSAMPSA